METLPSELRYQILILLPIQDLRNVRSSCKVLANAGFELLIQPDFSIRMDRDDCRRLAAIVEHDLSGSMKTGTRPLGHKIKKLSFDMSEADEYQARNNAYFTQYLRDPEDRNEAMTAALDEYRRFQNLKKTYAAYYCEPELLNAAIPYLPNLDTIDISLDNCPFDPTDEVWPRVWEFPTTRLLQRVLTTQRTTDILLATRPLPSPNANAKGIQTPINPKILTLTHSRLPLEFFTQPPRTFSSVVNSFTNLRALSLNLDYSPFPNDRYLIESFQGLGRCLSEAFSLQSLSLAYWGQTNPQLNIDVIFGSKTMWKQLHTFRLTGVKIVVEDLLGFLHRQKGTIKRLGIGGKGQGINRYGAYETMDFGSRIGFRDLCHGIRELVADGAILEKFNVMKNLRSTSGGSALSSRYAQLYDEEWQRVGEDDSWAHQVESFVLRCGRKPVHGFWHADAESEEADLVEMTQMFNDTAIYE